MIRVPKELGVIADVVLAYRTARYAALPISAATPPIHQHSARVFIPRKSRSPRKPIRTGSPERIHSAT